MRVIACVLAAFLAACGGNDVAPAPVEPNPAPALEETEPEPTLTKREVDRELDAIERQIETGGVDPRIVRVE